MICKRTKAGAVHYVKAITPLGRIDYLTPNRADARDLTADEVEKVKAAYAKRDGAGVLTFEPLVPPAAPEKPEKAAAPKG